MKTKIDIKEKTEELLEKRLKTCERNTQELSSSMKRQNLQIMGIEEGEEVQAKGIHNKFNKVRAENFTNLKKELSIHVQEASRTPNRPDQNRTSPQHFIIKTAITETRERILKAVTYKSKPIKITSDISTETLKARRAWNKIFRALKENNFSPRILYLAKLSFKTDGGISLP
jgi:predicted transcriptional regulator